MYSKTISNRMDVKHIMPSVMTDVLIVPSAVLCVQFPLKLSTPSICYILLMVCFVCSPSVCHGFLPDEMMAVALVPIIKSKSGRIMSKDNYRPIALASVVSKVLEKILLNRLYNNYFPRYVLKSIWFHKEAQY